MKLLTKDADYAIRALMYLAKNKGRFVSSKEIAQAERIPLYYVRRILQKLVQSKVIRSKEGVGGGLEILRNPYEIYLADMIRLFRGDIRISECMFRKKICPNRAGCVVRKRIQGIEKKIIEEFEQISIGNLLDDIGGKK